MADDADDPRPGEVHAGCALEGPLARGGMGAVWRARRVADGRAVVVKFLAAEARGDAGLAARFRREAEALARLRPTPHVVAVLGAAEAPRPCLVLEHVPGTPLDKAIHGAGRLPPLVAARIGRDVARGLAALHSHGLLHRDVKPSNVVVRPDGTATLVDLGVAKDQFRTGLTQPGELVGTAQYLAPEVWEEAPADERTDLFALGATLHHALAGAPPFQGEDLDAVCDAVLSGAAVPLSEAAPDAPPDLALLVARLLAVDPAQRPARAEDVAADLERVLAGEAVEAPALVDARGARRPLAPGEWFTLGSNPACEVPLSAPGVAPRHAQVRREGAGFVLYDFKSPSGTFLDGERVAPGVGRPLAHGAQLRLGPQVTLAFHDPRGAARGGTLVADAARVPVPGAVVEALADAGDPRATLALLERLAPDRAALAADDRALAARLGPAGAAAVAARRAELLAGLRERALQALAALAGGPADPAGWLAWWHQVRTTAPPQAVPAGPAPALFLRGAGGLEAPAPAAGALLAGRDPRCGLRLPGAAPRLAATFVRLARRVAAVAGPDPGALVVGGQAVRAALLDPGEALVVGGVPLVLAALEAEAPPAAGAPLAVEPVTFAAVAALGLPAAAPGLAAIIAAAGAGAAGAGAAGAAAGLPLPPDALAAAAGRLAARADAARRALAGLRGPPAAPGQGVVPRGLAP